MEVKNKKSPEKKGLFSSRKFKFGAAATAFTALFIVVVILVNVVVSAIDEKAPLYIDLTGDEVFSVSDESIQLVREMIDDAKKTSPDMKITISFLQPKDKLEGVKEKNWIVQLAENYEKAIPEIEILYNDDIYTNPGHYEPYTKLGESISQNSIIFQNSTSSAAYKIITFDSCMVYDEDGQDLWAVKGEMQFNSAFIQITSSQKPVVTFMTGHGESRPEGMIEVFTSCGFAIQEVDLSREEIPEDTKILVLNNPRKDLLKENSIEKESEYTRLLDYLNDYRNLMVILSPDTPSLPNLEELLKERSHIGIAAHEVLQDNSASLAGDNRFLVAQYSAEKGSNVLTDSLTYRSYPPKTVVPNAAPLEVEEMTNDDITVATILESSEDSFVEITGEDGKIKKKVGSFPIMALSSHHTIRDNVQVDGYVVVISSANFTETNLFEEQYGNSDILFNTIHLLTSTRSSGVSTHYKVLEDYSFTMVLGAVITYAIITAGVIPLAIFVFGIVVYVKRKHL